MLWRKDYELKPITAPMGLTPALIAGKETGNEGGIGAKSAVLLGN
jgi:hypothetical protein